jgi:hypothetical protein
MDANLGAIKASIFDQIQTPTDPQFVAEEIAYPGTINGIQGMKIYSKKADQSWASKPATPVENQR